MFHAKQQRIVTAATLALALIAASTAAAGESSWYLQGKLGQSSYQATVGQGAWAFDGDDGSASVELGYTLNPYIALEAGYHDLGRFAGSASPCPLGPGGCVAVVVPVTADLSGLSLAAVPRPNYVCICILGINSIRSVLGGAGSPLSG